ncbi:MAG: TIGR04100 family radical SAM protein [Clostridium sp.]|jgi:radical SAM enzyme (TIGR04100 family)
MEILYKVHNNLYVNLTNKCPCACTFCLRQNMDHVGESKSLWLEREPSAAEAIAEFAKFDMSRFNEVVFCGFGEPTEAFEVLKKVAAFVKETYHMPIRLNTNGLGNLVNGRDITPEMEGLIDTVSISLNTPNADRYHELVRSKFGDKSFDAMLDFARSSTKYVTNVVMTTVDTTITKEEEEECRRICDSIGAKYRIRPWED